VLRPCGGGRLLGAEENHRLRGSHGTFDPNPSDDVLAGSPALLTSEALASRFVNKQKQSSV